MKTQLLVVCIVFTFVMCNENSQTVYVTKSGTKYHNLNCKHLSKSSRSITFSDAKGKGYDACSVCKPITTTSIKKSTTNIFKSKTSNKDVKYVQCFAETQSGSRCKRNAKSSMGLCWQHVDN